MKLFRKDEIDLNKKVINWCILTQVVFIVISSVLLILSLCKIGDLNVTLLLVSLGIFAFFAILLFALSFSKISTKFLRHFALVSVFYSAACINLFSYIGCVAFALPIMYSTAFGKQKAVKTQIFISFIAVVVSYLFKLIMDKFNFDYVGFLIVYLPEILVLMLVGTGAMMVSSQIEKNTNNKVAKEIQRQGMSIPYPFVDGRDDIDIYACLYGDEHCRGDFFDYFFVDDNHLLFYVAEVSAKGLDGAVLLNSIRSVIREVSLEKMKVEDIVKHANERLIKDGGDGTLASIWIGILNTFSGKVMCLDGGQCTPFIRHTNGSFEPFKIKKNVMLGYSRADNFKSNTLFLEEGDTLFLYTKGLLGKDVSKEKLCEKLNEEKFENAKQFSENMALLRGNLNNLKDDLAVLTLKFLRHRDIYLSTVLNSFNDVDRFGGFETSRYTNEFLEQGFEYSDFAEIEANGNKVKAAVVPDYRYLKNGVTGILCWPDKDKKVVVCTFGGNLAKALGITENSTYPVKISFTLSQKKGYYADYITHDLHRTNNREDYPHLNDEEYCNFRMVKVANFGENILYRGCSPVDPGIGRNVYADTALKNHGVKTIFNLSSSLEISKKKVDYDKTYYSTCDVRFISYNANYDTPKTLHDTAEIFRMMLDDNTKTPMYLHCFEGQDRTGFLIGVLEAFMGATFKEIVSDFMVTYYNYYGVEKGNIRYAGMSMNIISELEEAFKKDDLYDYDMHELAVVYMKRIGLSDEEIAKLYKKLGK